MKKVNEINDLATQLESRLESTTYSIRETYGYNKKP